jgi:hypothetical protein
MCASMLSDWSNSRSTGTRARVTTVNLETMLLPRDGGGRLTV